MGKDTPRCQATRNHPKGLIDMGKVITATFVDGVLKPEQSLNLAEGARVRLTLETWVEPPIRSAMVDVLDELCAESPIDSRGRLLSRDELHERHRHPVDRFDRSDSAMRGVS